MGSAVFAGQYKLDDMIFGRVTSGWLSQASLNFCIRLSISSSPSASGVTCTLQPLATAKSWLAGSRAAIHSGGCGCCSGFGAEVDSGNDQCSPSCA